MSLANNLMRCKRGASSSGGMPPLMAMAMVMAGLDGGQSTTVVDAEVERERKG